MLVAPQVSFPVSDCRSNEKLAFLNRVLGETDGWPAVEAMLADFCTAFGAMAAGVRWPAEGMTVLLAETSTVRDPEFAAPLVIPNRAAGLFWADGVDADADRDVLRLAAGAIAHSRMLRQFFEPIAVQALIARRLEDAATVAGRVAHDFDNVFQGVSGFTALALELLDSNSAAHRNVLEAETAARHGMKFCSQLHQLSRAGIARPLPASVAAALAREVTRLKRTHPAVRLTVIADPTLPAVAVEGGGLQMLLGHLLDNAIEASVADATVTATARLVELGAAELPDFLGHPGVGPHVEVVVADAGSGTSEDAQKRMFVEPFFTTKFRHRGLGLTVVFRMLYAHRGGVRVESAPGQGTTIRVVFPLAAANAPVLEAGRTPGGYVK